MERVRSWRAARGGLVASMLVLFAVLVWWRSDPGVRLKGESSPVGDLELDLQVVIERRDTGGGTSFQRGEDGAVLEHGDGLLFRFEEEGGRHLLLIERDPDHRIRAIHTRHDLPGGGPGAQTVSITDQAGRPLRYVPDGPPGEYTYLAVLSREPIEVSSARLDALWARYVRSELDPATPDASPGEVIDAMRIRYEPGLEGGQLPAPGGDGEVPR